MDEYTEHYKSAFVQATTLNIRLGMLCRAIYGGAESQKEPCCKQDIYSRPIDLGDHLWLVVKSRPFAHFKASDKTNIAQTTAKLFARFHGWMGMIVKQC